MQTHPHHQSWEQKIKQQQGKDHKAERPALIIGDLSRVKLFTGTLLLNLVHGMGTLINLICR